MFIEKEKIRNIIKKNKAAGHKREEDEQLVDIFYEIINQVSHAQENTLATKDDIKMVIDNTKDEIKMVIDNTKNEIKMVIEMMDRRFEAVDRRFEAADKRFEDMNKRMSSLQWFIFLLFTVYSAIITIIVKFI